MKEFRVSHDQEEIYLHESGKHFFVLTDPISKKEKTYSKKEKNPSFFLER